MIIKVTQKDIDRGIGGFSNYCPIALAFQAIGYSNVNVGYQYLSAYRDNKEILIRSTKSVKTFLNAFDQGKKVLPKSFRFQPLVKPNL